jgi:hypothetical protein
MAKPKPAPVGDSMHTPRVKELKPSLTGNRAERREAERQIRHDAKKNKNPNG